MGPPKEPIVSHRAKFLQVLSVSDYRIESGAEAQRDPSGQVLTYNAVRIWLLGTPALPHHTVSGAFLEARSTWPEPAVPRYDFHRKRILVSYTMASIQPVVSMLLDGVQLYCQYRELEGGSIYADVHKAQQVPEGAAAEERHWVPAG